MNIDDKIKGGAIWESLKDSSEPISPESPSPQKPSVAQYYNPRSYCYICSREVPVNSKFCPWCQIELLVKCPKCGNEYSSQYPACNQCGTNRKVYIREQVRLEEQRLEIRRIEEEKKRVEEEQKKAEEERQRRENLEEERQEKIRKSQLRTRFLSENVEIIKTDEFKKVEALINDYEKYYQSNTSSRHSSFFSFAWILLVVAVISLIWVVGPIFTIGYHNNANTSIIFFVFSVIGCSICFLIDDSIPLKGHEKLFHKFIESKSIDNDIRLIIKASIFLIEQDTDVARNLLEKKTDFIILSYRKAYYKDYQAYRSCFFK